MASKQFSQAIRSRGNKSLVNLGKRIKKMHQNYDAQLRKAKSKARLRQIYLTQKRSSKTTTTASQRRGSHNQTSRKNALKIISR